MIINSTYLNCFPRFLWHACPLNRKRPWSNSPSLSSNITPRCPGLLHGKCLPLCWRSFQTNVGRVLLEFNHLLSSLNTCNMAIIKIYKSTYINYIVSLYGINLWLLLKPTIRILFRESLFVNFSVLKSSGYPPQNICVVMLVRYQIESNSWMDWIYRLHERWHDQS